MRKFIQARKNWSKKPSIIPGSFRGYLSSEYFLFRNHLSYFKALNKVGFGERQKRKRNREWTREETENEENRAEKGNIQEISNKILSLFKCRFLYSRIYECALPFSFTQE